MRPFLVDTHGVERAAVSFDRAAASQRPDDNYDNPNGDDDIGSLAGVHHREFGVYVQSYLHRDTDDQHDDPGKLVRKIDIIYNIIIVIIIIIK